MKIIPAVDLWEGKVVRLFKGDPARSTVYTVDPVETVRKWKEQGAKFLHLIDLSAALGQKDNLEVIERILKEVDIKIEVGGGIRAQEKAEKLISLGAERVIIGTKSLDESFLKSLLKSLGKEKVAVSVDAIDSQVAVKGWQEKQHLQALDFIRHLRKKGVKWVIYTDISRDGTLDGVDLSKVKELSSFKGLSIIFGGGVSSIDDLKKIKRQAPFLWGVITGKALYEGNIDLKKINVDNF